MNLWKNLGKITTQLTNSSPKVLMLDFDGTLAPIVKSPEKAHMSLKTGNLLQKLCQKPNLYLAVISGRKLEDIKKKVRLPDIIYGGNHGLEGEIFGKKYSFPIPNRVLKTIEQIKTQLNKIVVQFSGVFVEDKELVLAFHYRSAKKEQIPTIKSLLKETLKPYVKKGLISVVSGKMAIDIKPKVECNKGTFVKLIIDKVQTQTKKPPTAIFIGDDTTDEDIFRKLERGITVKVGKSKQSKAKYRLKDIVDVFKFLKWTDEQL